MYNNIIYNICKYTKTIKKFPESIRYRIQKYVHLPIFKNQNNAATGVQTQANCVAIQPPTTDLLTQFLFVGYLFKDKRHRHSDQYY
jgi:hypothetical protein